jgi:hypothetical protein
MKPIAMTMLLALVLVLAGCSEDTRQPTAPPDAPSDIALDKNAPGSLNPHVIPPHARPHGKSYSEWSALWWGWLWSAPYDVNPGLDETGENISYGQSGNVWFLAPAYFGTDWVRSANIPSGTMLFVDIAAYFGATIIGDGDDEAEIRAVLTPLVDAITDIVFEVDGLRLENLEDFRVQSPPGFFAYTLPENNMFQAFGFDAPAGDYADGVAEGYYAMLKPLSVGEHEVFISADFGPPYGLVQVTVHLTVVPRGQYMRMQQ